MCNISSATDLAACWSPHCKENFSVNAASDSRLVGPPALAATLPVKVRPSVVVISTEPAAAAAADTSLFSANSNLLASAITSGRVIEFGSKVSTIRAPSVINAATDQGKENLASYGVFGSFFSDLGWQTILAESGCTTAEILAISEIATPLAFAFAHATFTASRVTCESWQAG